MTLQCFTSHGLNNFQLFWLDKLTGDKRSVIVWDFAVTWIQNPLTRKFNECQQKPTNKSHSQE